MQKPCGGHAGRRPSNTLVPVVIGDGFGWTHLPKTGGDTTAAMLCAVPGEVRVQCMEPAGAALNGTLSCGAPAPGRRPVCPGF